MTFALCFPIKYQSCICTRARLQWLKFFRMIFEYFFLFFLFSFSPYDGWGRHNHVFFPAIEKDSFCGSGFLSVYKNPISRFFFSLYSQNFDHSRTRPSFPRRSDPHLVSSCLFVYSLHSKRNLEIYRSISRKGHRPYFRISSLSPLPVVVIVDQAIVLFSTAQEVREGRVADEEIDLKQNENKHEINV